MKNTASPIKILGLILLILFASASQAFCFDFGRVDIHGFLSQGYLKTDENNYFADTENGSFQFNEFGLNLTAPITESLRVGIQFFGRDLGPMGNDEISVDWVYGDYRWRDWLGVRFGKMKLDYGLYNEIREIDSLRNSIFLPNSVYNESWREELSTIKGIGFYGNLDVGKSGNFLYSFQMGNLTLDPDGSSASVLEKYLSEIGIKAAVNDYDSKPSIIYALTWETPLEGLRFKLSGEDTQGLKMAGTASGIIPADLNGNGNIEPGEGIAVNSVTYTTENSRFMVASVEYQFGDFLFAAEYFDGDRESHFDFGKGIKSVNSNPYTGWYFTGNYRFNRYFSAGLSYSEFVPDTYDKDGNKIKSRGRNDFEAWLKTWTVSTRFDISRNWLVKFETSYNDGWTKYDPMANSPEDLGQYWWLFAAKATVVF